jgi:outer membrane protein W
MNIGIRTEVAAYWKDKSYSAEILFFTITYDYYIPIKQTSFAPFVGIGIGYYLMRALDYNRLSDTVPYPPFFKHHNFMGTLRLGFELTKFRTVISYNLIRKKNGYSSYDKIDDYISFMVGFYLGGGKWKKVIPVQ